jgi:transcriptional antiterminator RfaH
MDLETSGKVWFALYTKPHKEYLVRDLLCRQGCEVYLPEVAVAVRRRDRRECKPFFPHYLFARLVPGSEAMARARWTPGLRAIVSADGQAIPVPDEVIGHIRRRLATMEMGRPEEPFRKGEAVRVQRGPFEGLDAVFDRRLSPAGRVRVFLQWMSRWVAAELDLGDLLPPR